MMGEISGMASKWSEAPHDLGKDWVHDELRMAGYVVSSDAHRAMFLAG